jgi:hypothetical protein
MTQTITIVTLLALAGYPIWRYRYRKAQPNRKSIHVAIRLDREAPGAHLIWDITNVGSLPVTLTKLIVHGHRGAVDTVPLGLPHILKPEESTLLPTDVDWSLLAAKSVAVADDTGREYSASRRALANIQEHLRQLIDRRVHITSARDFLFGATDLAFGVVILGLGFFMLMWVIATG